MVNGSKPESRQAGAISGICRGLILATASAIALMCSGVVPQQPPTIFNSPDCANSAMVLAMASGPKS